jgi:hypothetical protein
MKKLFYITLLLPLAAISQTKNEVKLNILNTIVLGSVEVGYERFIAGDQSIGIEVFINDRFSYSEEKPRRGKEFNTNSVMLSYNFYFSEERSSGYYISPFFKYRFGNHEEVKDGIKVKTDMDSPILGLGAGYKWIWRDKFTVAPYANIGRNFSNDVNDRFSAVEINAGIGIGYRF